MSECAGCTAIRLLYTTYREIAQAEIARLKKQRKALKKQRNELVKLVTEARDREAFPLKCVSDRLEMDRSAEVPNEGE